jgi:hypothetical protein
MGEFEAKIVTGTDKKNWFDLFICKLISLTHPFKNLPKNLKCYRYNHQYLLYKKKNKHKKRQEKKRIERNKYNFLFFV